MKKYFLLVLLLFPSVSKAEDLSLMTGAEITLSGYACADIGYRLFDDHISKQTDILVPILGAFGGFAYYGIKSGDGPYEVADLMCFYSGILTRSILQF